MTSQRHEPASARRGALSTVILIILMGLTVGAITGWMLVQRREADRCISNLHAMYGVLELYEMENGVLPRLDFFPNSAMAGENSLRVFVENQGLNGDSCVCPASPRVIRDAGLSYLWNVELNGGKLVRREAPVWMMVEIQALSDQVPAPHRGKYHVLYTDGTVQRVSELPSGLVPVAAGAGPGPDEMQD